jgi:hypothetical protein
VEGLVSSLMCNYSFAWGGGGQRGEGRERGSRGSGRRGGGCIHYQVVQVID